ncbi:hypothetical protein QLL95_gp0756 [Cotonvirus japonicus]|uniref:Uncharacterized protein n=1 Tax=Cotonvirus japonicus TaxID=2811091 RepID=A0ABM7NTG7_9VIRU|nr:hypothetical protein QLL95_gp0756 [Cotonvirus japonicus]BCS83367.1 hypothetical protein [Cotonvirus japonicus]
MGNKYSHVCSVCNIRFKLHKNYKNIDENESKNDFNSSNKIICSKCKILNERQKQNTQTSIYEYADYQLKYNDKYIKHDIPNYYIRSFYFCH